VTDPRIDLLEQELTRRREELESAVAAVPPESRGWAPKDGAWSVAFVVEHLAHTERSVTGLLAKLMRGVSPRTGEKFSRDHFLRHIDMPWFLDRTRRIEGAQPSGGMSADEAWASLQNTRRDLLAVLREGDGLRLEDKSFNHPTGMPLDGYQWTAFLALHEARHAAQIREILGVLRT
jgi:hypothetical protein